jgi:diguanylate cyclase (GGDEF)-like protein
MLDRLENAIVHARRRGSRIAVLFVDLDRFKQINDSRGHAVGDEVLQLVARRLESVVRQSDTVSRHGGDEFLVLLSDVAQASDAARVAAKMLSTLAAPAIVGGEAMRVSASIGITIFPEDGRMPPTWSARPTRPCTAPRPRRRMALRSRTSAFPIDCHEPGSHDGTEPTPATPNARQSGTRTTATCARPTSTSSSPP